MAKTKTDFSPHSSADIPSFISRIRHLSPEEKEELKRRILLSLKGMA